MKIAIIGYGYVGKAIASIFPNSNIEIVDPNWFQLQIEQLESPEFVFICVGTPPTSTGACDYSAVIDSVQRVTKSFPKAICVVKSTVTPDGIDELLKINPNIVYNPEFLTAANSYQDIQNSKFSIIGCDGMASFGLILLYRGHSTIRSDCEYRIVSTHAASFAKYTINSFLALKVAYMNEIHALVGDANLWEDIVKAVSMDPRIGSSHMQVPGPDGQFGFGGACFPKDTQALWEFADTVAGVEMPILATAITENKKRRNDQ